MGTEACMPKDLREPIQALTEHIRLKMEADGIPGLAMGVTDRDGMIWEAAFGYSDIDARKALTPDHLFQIGSISKSFTDVVLLQMRDEGILDIHRAVDEYIPWFEVGSALGTITPHHLMTHTAGIPLGSDDTISATTEVMALRGLDVSTPPGEHFHYSNTGYKTLGLVVERLSGRAFPDELKDRVLKPLEMQSSEPVIANSHRDRLAVGYAPALDDRPLPRGGMLAQSTWFESDTADGSICSTARDMCKYIRMILNRGQGPGARILSEEAFSLLITPYIRPDDSVHGEEYAYGLNIERVEGHLYVGHTGGMVGFHSSMLIDMDEGIGVVVMVNSPGRPEEISRVALGLLRSDMQGQRPAIVPEDPLIVENAEQYTGEYLSADGRTIQVRAGEGGLWAACGGAEGRAERLGEDRFLVPNHTLEMYELRFGRSEGVVVEALHGGDAYFNDRYSGPREFATPEEWAGYTGHFSSHNPWLTNFRVVIRKGELRIVDSTGLDEALVPLAEHLFRISSDPRCPETVRFGAFIDGRANMAYLSGGALTRVFTA
jgi:D-alanyl-D-alanine carboxypeptidase